MWLKAFGMGLDETMLEDVVLVDLDGRQLEGEPRALPNELHLHAGILRHRPDVGAVVHTHPAVTSAFAATQARFLALSQDSMFFRDRLGHYPDPRLVTSPKEGQALGAALGDGRLVVLRNHGLAAADSSMAGAVFLALAFERSLRLQRDAATFGSVAEMTDDEAADLCAALEAGYADRVRSTWMYLGRRLEHRGLSV